MGYVRDLQAPGFAGDDGSASPALAEALRAYDTDPDARHEATLAVLQGSRLLVPVVAVAVDLEYDDDGTPHDKTSDMATVLVQGRDGRRALLAFTSTAALHAWRSDARPVPVTAARAAEAALQDGAAAIVVDVAGPVVFVVGEDDLRELARGSLLVRLVAGPGSRLSGRYGWVTPDR
jgi:SseB protein N-terminal domain